MRRNEQIGIRRATMQRERRTYAHHQTSTVERTESTENEDGHVDTCARRRRGENPSVVGGLSVFVERLTHVELGSRCLEVDGAGVSLIRQRWR